MDAKAIVIGTGFGGAVAALRLGQAGVDTIVLERGRRWPITDPTTNSTFATFRNPDGRAEWLNSVTKTPGYEGMPIEKYTGVLEVIESKELTLLAGAGVGGGSLVYGGILIEPPRHLWDQIYGIWVNYDEMEKEYFPRVRSIIKNSAIPNDILNSKYYAGQKLLYEQARKAGFPEVENTMGAKDGICRFKMAVDWDIVREEIQGTKVPSVIAAEFWFGNNSGGKQTLDRDYLKLAENTGSIDLRPLHNVQQIAPREGGGYEVHVDRIDESGEVQEHLVLTCAHLFMAAGCVGTNKLLMKSKAMGTLPNVSDELGQGFGQDGDVFAIRHQIPAAANGYLGGPGALAVMNYENPQRACVMMRAPFTRFEQDFPNNDVIGSFIFTMTSNRGSLKYHTEADQLQVGYTPDSDEPARILIERLNEAGGGKLHSIASRVTGHQLGGAGMGSVCDDRGRVSGYPKLYVVDGALVPGSTTCVNPALTIAALAERCLDGILAKDIPG